MLNLDEFCGSEARFHIFHLEIGRFLPVSGKDSAGAWACNLPIPHATLAHETPLRLLAKDMDCPSLNHDLDAWSVEFWVLILWFDITMMHMVDHNMSCEPPSNSVLWLDIMWPTLGRPSRFFCVSQVESKIGENNLWCTFHPLFRWSKQVGNLEIAPEFIEQHRVGTLPWFHSVILTRCPPQSLTLFAEW